MKQKFRNYAWLAGIISVMLLTGCGGAGSGGIATGGGGNAGAGGGGAAPAVTISGNAMLGPWSGATVNIYSLNATGGAGAKVAGPIQTGANGSWTPVMPNGTGPWLVQASGGSYVDEATGTTVSMAGKKIEAVMVSNISHVTLSPLAQALTERVRFLIAQGFTPLQSVAMAHDQFVAVFGIDPVNDNTIKPSAMISVSNSDRTLIYAAILGGLSSMAQSPAMTALGSANPADVALALASDMADLKLDGMDVNGRVILVQTPGGNVALPALDTAGLNALNTAAQLFATGKAGRAFSNWHINSFGWFAGLPAVRYGQLALSGSAAGVIGSNLFVPQLVAAGAGNPSWDSESVGSAPINVTITTGFVNMVYVRYQPAGVFGASYAWSRTDLTGVTIDSVNRQVIFNGAVLPPQAGVLTGNTTQLVLNGTLSY